MLSDLTVSAIGFGGTVNEDGGICLIKMIMGEILSNEMVNNHKLYNNPSWITYMYITGSRRRRDSSDGKGNTRLT